MSSLPELCTGNSTIMIVWPLTEIRFIVPSVAEDVLVKFQFFSK